MKLAIAIGFAFVCAAQPLLPARAHAQQAVTSPGSGSAVNPGFTHVFQAGIARTASGWMARDFPTVSAVVEGSAAARAGLKVGDVIVSVNGHDARRPPLFTGLRHGAAVVMRVRRGDEERDVRYEVEK
jgi:S1-C subfamily serine protease